MIRDLVDGDPREIGPYRLLGRLGSGGMGVVYLAAAPSDDVVAVKLIRADFAQDPAFRARFRREVAAARRVGGICTARVRDADLDVERPWVVTDFVPGPSLADLVTSHGPLPPSQLRPLAVGLAEALTAVHSAGVVHRDVKPTNVLCSPEGPRLIDFGIAQATDATSATLTGQVVGSPSWMAPEQIRGQNVSAALDMFALGSVLVFAATGRPPFGEGQLESVMYRILHEPPNLGEPGQWPVDLRPVVEGLLDKDPACRPTARELFATLTGSATDPMQAVATELDRTWVLPTEETAPFAAVPGGHLGPTPAPKHRPASHSLGILAIVAVLGVLGAGVTYALTRHTHNPNASSATTTASLPASSSTTLPTTTAAPATTTAPSTTATTQPPASVTSVALPVVTCPSSYGGGSWSGDTIPPQITIRTDSVSASELQFYSNDTRNMTPVLAPKGWSCQVSVSADGGTSIAVYPAGATVPTPTDGRPVVVARSQGACQGCVYSAVCALAPTAANTEYPDYASSPGCQPLPSDERVYWIRGSSSSTITATPDDVIAYQDPNVPDTDNGVMLYEYGYSGGTGSNTSFGQASQDDCVLPDSQRSLCTTILNNFSSSNWLMP